MFTGIVTDQGRVRAIEGQGDLRYEIETAYDMSTVDVGASIACNGCCLTVIEKGEGWFAVEASQETLDVTSLNQWRVGSIINLERALKMGDEMGGHIVSGHVDGQATITSITPENESIRYRFEVPSALAQFIAAKGSVTMDGVSLTVNEVEGDVFGVNIIPYTSSVTTFGRYEVGQKVNLEIDMLARYVARLLSHQAGNKA